MWQAKVLLLVVVCGSTIAQIQDATRQAGAAGPQVVEAVISLIRESCVFPDDRLLLRRFAFMVTNDGQNVDTYRPGFDGGIWAVLLTTFQGTQNSPALQPYYQDIANRFGISWNSVQWSDLRKPLYSGLAAALAMVQTFGANVPVGVERQAAWFQKTFYPNDPMAAYNFTKQADQIFSGCTSSNLDLAFMVDSSSSLSPVDFNDALSFAADVLDKFSVGPSDVQVAFLTFGTGFKTVFDFNDHSTKADVQAAIKGAQYQPGETDTDLALGYAANTLFVPGGAAGARASSAKVAVLVTDGKATHSADAILKAQELRQTGVTVFVIGVGSAVDKTELSSLATEPDCTHVQLLTDYQDLDTLRAEIQRLSCRAPVILKEGNYTFPCDSTSNFRIAINGNETITIRPRNGFVDIYGSFLNPYPNTAFNEFKTRATAVREAIIYVKDESRPLYLSIVSQGTDPVFCKAGHNYDIIVQNKNAIQPDALITCYENGILRQCTPLDILTALYRVVQPASLGFPNPCQPNHPGYFPHPLAYDRFVYCDNKGVAYLVFCPANFWYNDFSRGCVPGTPPPVIAATSTPSPTTSKPRPTTSLPPAITSSPGGNPCTQEALNRGDRFFPYPSDEHKYIACTEWPNYGVIKDCAPYHKWSQHDLSCIYMNTVVDPTKDIYISTPDPLSLECKVGLVDSDTFYHPYPGDNTKFIQCDQFGDAFVMSCPAGRIWNQHFLTCTPNSLLPSGNAPIG
ncbi:uncharacterized protein LOC143276211 [Babylonia areolata]|uniref:uncharacterized protein LOC143276211 n=1 Tax=Babylonia areolata TaxID=304850 RepID=UPI003FD27083